MAFTSNPLSPSLGAEILNLDLAKPLTDQVFEELHQIWLAHDGLLVIRNQHITPEQHISFSRNFGPLFGEADHFQSTVHKYLLPGQPAIYRVSNKVEDGVPQGRSRAGNYWHSDVSFRERPASASLLYAIEIPPTGGDTMFADMYQAYDALSQEMKHLLSNLNAVHDFAVAAASSGTYSAEQLNNDDFDGTNRFIHPVVITHPKTGRKALYVNPGFTAALVGFSPQESTALLSFLYAHTINPEFVYRHSWRANDLVIWDNRSLMHYAVVDYEGLGERYLHRTTVIAERPQA